MKKIFLLIAVCLLFSGCMTSAKTEPVSTSVTYPAASAADYSLPEEYTFSDETTASIIRIEDNQIVGGIILTDLHAECVLSDNCTHLREYLTGLAPMPKYVEYLSMLFENRAFISVAITDPEADTRAEQSHTLFEKDSIWFDIWLDKALVSEEERNSLLSAVAP